MIYSLLNIMNILIAIVVVLIVYLIYVYNRLITLKNRAQESVSDIDVQLKRRYDLIPNLVDTVKGYAKHEKETFENIARLRSVAMQQQGLNPDKAKAENALSGALKSIFAVAESYPELKASQNFLELQKDIVDTEDKLQAARRFYNMNVLAINTAIQVFPNNLLAGMMGFKNMEFFELENEQEKKVVNVTL
jgi:LemA protein